MLHLARGGDYNHPVYSGIKALPDVGRSIGMARFDLEGNPLPVARGHEVDGLAAANGVFLADFITAGLQVLGEAPFPVSVYRSSLSI